MIYTKFEAYCQDCSELEPTVEKFYSDGTVLFQSITCEHINRCRKIARYVEKCSEKKGEKQ